MAASGGKAALAQIFPKEIFSEILQWLPDRDRFLRFGLASKEALALAYGSYRHVTVDGGNHENKTPWFFFNDKILDELRKAKTHEHAEAGAAVLKKMVDDFIASHPLLGRIDRLGVKSLSLLGYSRVYSPLPILLINHFSNIEKLDLSWECNDTWEAKNAGFDEANTKALPSVGHKVAKLPYLTSLKFQEATSHYLFSDFDFSHLTELTLASRGAWRRHGFLPRFIASINNATNLTKLQFHKYSNFEENPINFSNMTKLVSVGVFNGTGVNLGTELRNLRTPTLKTLVYNALEQYTASNWDVDWSDLPDSIESLTVRLFFNTNKNVEQMIEPTLPAFERLVRRLGSLRVANVTAPLASCLSGHKVLEELTIEMKADNYVNENILPKKFESDMVKALATMPALKKLNLLHATKLKDMTKELVDRFQSLTHIGFYQHYAGYGGEIPKVLELFSDKITSFALTFDHGYGMMFSKAVAVFVVRRFPRLESFEFDGQNTLDPAAFAALDQLPHLKRISLSFLRYKGEDIMARAVSKQLLLNTLHGLKSLQSFHATNLTRDVTVEVLKKECPWITDASLQLTSEVKKYTDAVD